MSAYKNVVTSTAPPTFPWRSLVERSISSWDNLPFLKNEKRNGSHARMLQEDLLRSCGCLDEFLHLASDVLMFWFFLRREAFLDQKEMNKWSRDRLNDYVLLPATPGSINRHDCFFMSHFWRSKCDPDPGGEYLRSFQRELKQQEWSYIWVDWTCTPQAPRSPVEESYFARSLDTVSAIIRSCGLIWIYPPFEARMWILYEVAEFILTSSDEFSTTSDIQRFVDHVKEMAQKGVHHVLNRYSYRCTNTRDKVFLTSWLELLVLLKVLAINITDMRKLMDDITWFPGSKQIIIHSADGVLKLEKFQGSLNLNGKKWTFTPFPTSCAALD